MSYAYHFHLRPGDMADLRPTQIREMNHALAEMKRDAEKARRS